MIEKFFLEALKANLNILNEELMETKLDLDRSHQRFKKGMMLVLIGAGALLLSESSQLAGSGGRGRGRRGGRGNSLNTGLYIAGAASIAVGIVICFDSHKFIGRAGTIHSKKKRVTITPLY